ncbi:MAG TPA: hypothetical protein VIT38_11055 [Allosphingosinicella sp.]
MRLLMLLSLLAAPAAAFNPDSLVWEDVSALQRATNGCPDRALRPTGHHVPDPHRELLHLLEGMIQVDPAACPGVREAGAAEIRRRIGMPERADVDLALLELGWRIAEEGRGMAPDSALADRYGRMLWLFTERAPPMPRWPEEARAAFLARPETIRLLQAQTGNERTATRRARERLGEALLNRELPTYDPATAVALLERSESGLRASQLLTDGAHLPVDYPRAARLHLWLAGTPPGVRDDLFAELIRIARLAAGAASTPVARAEALRIVFAAGVHDPSVVAAERARLLAAIGRPPTVPLIAGDADHIARALNWHFAFDMPDADLGGAPRGSPPARLRGLIGPDGRMALVEIVRPSLGRRSDEALIGVWAERGARVDLGATARGRFVWVDLPPVDPGMDTGEVQERWGEPDLD